MYSEEDLMLHLAGLVPREMREPAVDRAHTWGIAGYPLASVYAPLQEWRDAYGEEEALAHGTLFRELDKPFLAGEVRK